MKSRRVYKLHLKHLERIEEQHHALVEAIRQLQEIRADLDDLMANQPAPSRTGFKKPRGGAHDDVSGSA